MPRVALQTLAAQVPAEQALAEFDGLPGVELVQPFSLPRLLARLDDHRGHVPAELIRMHLEPAVLGPLERERERAEQMAGPQPDEPALAHVDVGLEDRRVLAPGPAVDAVRRHDQVGVRERRSARDLVFEGLRDAERGRAGLQDVQEPLAADAAESVPSRADRLAPQVHVDVVPVVEVGHDRVVRLAVDVAKALHRLVREHDAPAEGVVGPVALIDLDPGARQRPLEEDCRVKPGRAAAETHDALHGYSGLPHGTGELF